MLVFQFDYDNTWHWVIIYRYMCYNLCKMNYYKPSGKSYLAKTYYFFHKFILYIVGRQIKILIILYVVKLLHTWHERAISLKI